MIVSVCIAVLNEELYLPKIIQCLHQQTYDHQKIEILFADGGSSDRSTQIIQDFIQNNDFYQVKLLHNEKKIIATAQNLMFKHMQGDYSLKIDAHASIPDDFIEKNVKLALTGEKVCGGIRPTIYQSDKLMSKLLHITEESVFGSSFANYRKTEQSKIYVKSIFHGMYAKEVITTVGGYNEQLTRTEDNEFHYRIRQHGYKICLESSIVSYQYIRPTFCKTLKQKYSNGYWIGRTFFVVKECLSLFHFVPFVFFIALLFSIALLPITNLFLIALMSLYTLTALIVAILESIKHRNFIGLFMPFVVFCIHICYGFGTLIGLIKGFMLRFK